MFKWKLELVRSVFTYVVHFNYYFCGSSVTDWLGQKKIRRLPHGWWQLPHCKICEHIDGSCNIVSLTAKVQSC